MIIPMPLSDEYNTPPFIIDMARRVMGGHIDLDPATNAAADNYILARESYTKEDDGLQMPWDVGAVWLNPPYSRGLIDRFIFKLLREDWGAALVLVNNATDTDWARRLCTNERTKLICFTPRISFIDAKTGKPKKGNPRGQMIVGLGRLLNEATFMDVFGDFGWCVKPAR